ncbi:MAG: D-alanyl-D-alanine carboxypeptidase [Firmicutes bacterium]|nr:D-alanyl-D-alanine carboxypeptidase [Bacillota bacterium]
MEDFTLSSVEHETVGVTIMDVSTGFVVYESAQHELLYPASITKIMTALLVLEEVQDLDEELVYSDNSVLSLPYYASRMHALPGDVMTVREALYGLMLPSGNEVANALAEHVSGNIDFFVNHMNRRAVELGAVNTKFINPSGLPGDDQHTTAYDMALIMKQAITHPVFNEVIGTSEFLIDRPLQNFHDGLTIRNTNLLIRPGEFFDSRVIGSKTGFTDAAQHTLVTYARDGDTELIISALFGGRYVPTRDTITLMDYAFSLPRVVIFNRYQYDFEIPVKQEIDGELETIATVTIRPAESISVPVQPANMPEIQEIRDFPEYLSPPVRVGDIVGQTEVFANSQSLGTMNLVAESSALPTVPAIHRGNPEPQELVGIVSTPPNDTPFGGLFSNTTSILTTAISIILPIIALLLACTVILMLRRRNKIIQRRRRMARNRNNQYARLRFSKNI